MRLFVAAALSMILFGTGQASPPPAATSEYLRSTGAGFAMNADHGVRYAMNFAVVKTLTAPLYVTVLFENTSGEGEPQSMESVLAVGATELVAKSERLSEIRNGRRYKVEVRLYADEERTELLGTHTQEVEFSAPREVAKQLSKQFGIQID
jgi:hypothetical protein